MKGDFSKLQFDPMQNYSGVLHQQGRALLDQDWNAANKINSYLRQQQGRDTIGAGVAAVPAETPDSFKVVEARSDGVTVNITLHPGRVWVDGMVLQVAGSEPYSRPATYLAPPIQDPQADPATIAEGVRDAVILEVWEEAFNAFQDPLQLIEPALGGVDTTERVKLSHHLRLLRLESGEDCHDLAGKLVDDFDAKGKLTVSATTVDIEDECPVELGGGYTGFEHYLFRIEIAQADAANNARFKYSRFNGGLVGRGTYDTDKKEITIVANDQMINHCGLSNFYLEALKAEPDGGHWEVVFTAVATLSADGKLSLTNTSGTWSGGEMFFRLWDGIALIEGFPTGSATPNELVPGLGIRLELDAPTAGNTNYTPGDYWTFPVRTAGVDFDPVVWPTNAPPQGVHYHRVPLAILNWNSSAELAELYGAGDIQDCRKKFPPLVDISAGCCIAVKPGSDIHGALKKIIEAGGGCLCLLPGDHYLTKPLDFSQRSGIHIKGFGIVSRLRIADSIKDASPFILSGSQDISFESFAVFSQNGAPVWSCEQSRRLTIRNMFVAATFLAKSYPVIAINGYKCHEWRLENNVFSGPVGMTGSLLSHSTISGNLWQGTVRGIDLKYLQRSKVEDNRFIGIQGGLVPKFEAEIETIINTKAFVSRALLNLVERTLVRPERPIIAPLYIALDISVSFDVDIINNYFLGSIGISVELMEKCKIHANDFMTTVTAASCGLVHSLRFSENRVGQRAGEFNKQKGISCQVGLLILADAIDCQIVNNSFANVQQGIVFESDIIGRRAVSRDFAANVFSLKKVTNDSARKLLLESEARVKTRLDKQLLLNSTFFRIGKSEHTLIQGNQFYAAQTGIEWSGTKNIVDFRIVNNSFINCQDVAIQIEPDDRIFYLADPVDTKVRLIEKNRFDVYSGAVRATIGAVRVEKNDIRIKPPRTVLVPPIIVMVAVAENIYRMEPYTKAVKASDVPMMRMMTAELTDAVKKNPDTINTAGFSKTVSDNILNKYKPQKGDIWADKAFVLKTFADISANNYLVTEINTNVRKVKLNIEGYAVNLSGTQNRAVHNRIYGNNSLRPGGIVFHVASGEVRDNEVSVPAIALLLSGKAGLPDAYKGVEIVGNSLTASGIPGKKNTIYALAIPSLSPGNLSITNNQFKGSVMVGGDPISAQGFTTKDKFKVADEVIFYNFIKYDMPTYAISAVAKAFPYIIGDFGKFKPPITVIPIWVSDPHANRPVVQFSNNRLIQGWLGIFQAISGAYWSKDLLKKLDHKALVANLAANVMDYGGSVVGRDVIIVGNQSQLALKYRVGRRAETVANIPAAQSF